MEAGSFWFRETAFMACIFTDAACQNIYLPAFILLSGNHQKVNPGCSLQGFFIDGLTDHHPLYPHHNKSYKFKSNQIKSCSLDQCHTNWFISIVMVHGQYWEHLPPLTMMYLVFYYTPCDPMVVICYLIWSCDMAVHITYFISHSSSLSCYTVIK